MNRTLARALVALPWLVGACATVLVLPGCGGCRFRDVVSQSDLQQADVIAHGSVVSSTWDANTRLLTDTFQVDDVWKGNNFPRTLTYQIAPCEPAREAVLILSKAQADSVRATGRIEGDYRAYDAGSVEDHMPLQWRLTHDWRVSLLLGLAGAFLLSIALAVTGFVLIKRSMPKAARG